MPLPTHGDQSRLVRRWAIKLALALLWGGLALLPTTALADEPKNISPADIEFFETSVRPVLAKHCHECHSAKKQESGLRLDSRTALMAGGDGGPVLVPGDVEGSRLIRAVRHEGLLHMPPSGKLEDGAIAALAKWVERGAAWPKADAEVRPPAPGATGFRITPEDRTFWSFRPVLDPKSPGVRNTAWPQEGMDRFVMARLEAAGLQPSSPADKRTLIRRVTFDLIGLPPTPEEVDAFVQDESAEAFAKVVERLLASPRYGERWARHWLDVARYGEDQAHTFQGSRPSTTIFPTTSSSSSRSPPT
jgi:hypothetical protein